MPSPFATYGTFFDVEYRVNGLWNTLLAQYYTPRGLTNSDYIISPEAYPKPGDTKGLKADLLVSQLIEGAATFSISTANLVYEGKGANGDKFEKIEKQLQDWLKEAAKPAQFDCWVIGTRGAQVQFFKWKRDWFQEIKWNGQIEEGTKIYDIRVDNDWDSVQNILQAFVNNPP